MHLVKSGRKVAKLAAMIPIPASRIEVKARGWIVVQKSVPLLVRAGMYLIRTHEAILPLAELAMTSRLK
jgi:hypothetical protein